MQRGAVMEAASAKETFESSLKLLLISLVMTLAACSPPKESRVLRVLVNRDEFIVNGQRYTTAAELKAGLQAQPHADAIGLIQESSISPERHHEAISAIQEAGLDIPIIFVGNEVFY
jgi:hypothetical protein